MGAQVSMEESQEELTSGLDVGECEKRAREMLRVGRDAIVTGEGHSAQWSEGLFLPQPCSGTPCVPPWGM